jgi:2',3'-cyclic-nucleotide 2'-phosphodiesterase (5'-nucleotidase family)
MIYTADQLGDLAVGDVIKSITFYPTTSTLILSGGEIHVYMASTTQSNYDAAFEAVSVDYDNDGKADVVISDPLADKKQGEGENRGHPEDVAMVAEEMSAHRKR